MFALLFVLKKKSVNITPCESKWFFLFSCILSFSNIHPVSWIYPQGIRCLRVVHIYFSWLLCETRRSLLYKAIVHFLVYEIIYLKGSWLFLPIVVLYFRFLVENERIYNDVCIFCLSNLTFTYRSNKNASILNWDLRMVFV